MKRSSLPRYRMCQRQQLRATRFNSKWRMWTFSSHTNNNSNTLQQPHSTRRAVSSSELASRACKKKIKTTGVEWHRMEWNWNIHLIYRQQPKSHSKLHWSQSTSMQHLCQEVGQTLSIIIISNRCSSKHFSIALARPTAASSPPSQRSINRSKEASYCQHQRFNRLIGLESGRPSHSVTRSASQRA